MLQQLPNAEPSQVTPSPQVASWLTVSDDDDDDGPGTDTVSVGPGCVDDACAGEQSPKPGWQPVPQYESSCDGWCE